MSRVARRPEVLLGLGAVLLLAAAAVYLAAARGVSSWPLLLRGGVGSALLLLAGGEALAHRFTPVSLAPLRPLLVLPLGAAAAPLALTVLGFAHVPFDVNLVLVLLAGLGASVLVRRRGTPPPPADRPAAWAYVGVALVLVAVTLTPAFHFDQASVPGENPDSHQVVGSALLLQQAPPTATRVALPIDVVPSVWRSKYPIFYALAGASRLAGLDPVHVFGTLSAVLVALTAVGFGLLAVGCFGVPPLLGAVVAAMLGLSLGTLHLALHPYYNQLWGLATLPYSLLFAWVALRDEDSRAAGLCALFLLLAVLAYPLAIPYPLLLAALFAWRLRRVPRIPAWARRRPWLLLPVLGLLAIPLYGAGEKLVTGTQNLVHPGGGGLWDGDIKTFFPFGDFVGTGGRVIGAVIVLGFALGALRWVVPRAAGAAFAVAGVLFALFFLRLRLTSTGAYFDFKHGTCVGALVLALGASAAIALLRSPRRGLAGLGLAALVAWAVAAVVHDRHELVVTPPQVDRATLELHTWAEELPPGASIRVDIPPSGLEYWVAYELAPRPLTGIDPQYGTTYAQVPRGPKADYSLALRYPAGTEYDRDRQEFEPVPFAVGRPVRQNSRFVLRRLVFPPALARRLPDTASQRMVQP